VEARLRSEIELAARRSEHELKLSAVKATSQARAAKGALVATSSLAAFAVIGALALEFGVHRPELRRLQARLDSELATERTRSEHVKALLDQSERRARLLENALEQAPTRPDNPAPAAADPAPRPRSPRPPPRPSRPERRPCTGNPDDPLNPCL
jgi:hypothetical protein